MAFLDLMRILLPMSIKKILHNLEHIGQLMANLSDRVDANTKSLQAISDKLDTIIATPAVSNDPAVKAQLTQIQTDLEGTSAAVTATAVDAAAAPSTVVTPAAPAVGS